MGDRDKRKVKEIEEKDAVLRIAVTVAVILLVIGIIVVVVKVLNPKADTQKGLQKLKQMEEQSDMALKRMGSLSILKQKIDSIVNVPDRQTK